MIALFTILERENQLRINFLLKNCLYSAFKWFIFKSVDVRNDLNLQFNVTIRTITLNKDSPLAKTELQLISEV